MDRRTCDRRLVRSVFWRDSIGPDEPLVLDDLKIATNIWLVCPSGDCITVRKMPPGRMSISQSTVLNLFSSAIVRKDASTESRVLPAALSRAFLPRLNRQSGFEQQSQTIRTAMVSLSVSFASWEKSVDEQQQLLAGKAFKAIPTQAERD